MAYLCCLLAILPELIALYQQFDLHPEKIVFGRTHVSGLAWYFWGSQFGRFFNSGPIVNTHGNPFFFIHTYLWAFLPWSLIFIAANFKIIKKFKTMSVKEKTPLIFLLGSFWLTFIMFSATKFQLDHYTNIIMPFAAILCAQHIIENSSKCLALIQQILCILLLILSIILVLYLFKSSLASITLLFPVMIFIAMLYFRNSANFNKIIIFPSLTVIWIFILVLEIYAIAYKPYDVGYNLAKIINRLPAAAIYDIDANALPLNFYAKYPYYKIASTDKLPLNDKSYYFIVKQTDKLNENLFKQSQEVATFCGNTIDKVLPYYHNPEHLQQHLECFSVYFKSAGEKYAR